MGLALFMFHIDTFNITTGIYQIGIARPVASALLIWDVFVNIFLTAVFVRHCKPYMVKGLRNLLISSYQRTAEEDHTSTPEKVIGWWRRGHTHLTRCIDTSDSEGILGMLGHFSIHSYQFLASAVLGWEGRGLVLLHALHY